MVKTSIRNALNLLALLLAAGMVLAGPGIRDNGARLVWVMLGLALVLPFYLLIVRRRAHQPRLEAGE